MKGAAKAILNSGQNILILTTYEHIVAHYLLVMFETGNWYYSASMAFIQLTSLKRSMLENLPRADVDEIIKKAAFERSSYFGSDKHREFSSKSGKAAGEKRKQRMNEDPEFAEYIKSKLRDPAAV